MNVNNYWKVLWNRWQSICTTYVAFTYKNKCALCFITSLYLIKSNCQRWRGDICQWWRYLIYRIYCNVFKMCLVFGNQNTYIIQIFIVSPKLMLETSNCNLVIFWRCSWGTQWSDWWMSEWRRGESHRCGCPESCPRPPPCGAAHSRGQSRSSCSSKCEILLRPWDATQTPEWC